MRKFIASLCVVLMCFVSIPTYAFADDDDVGEAVAPLRKNQRAPFAGTLFSTNAAARLLIDAEFNLEVAQLETDRQLQLQAAGFQLEIDRRDADILMWETKYTDVLAIRDQQVTYLEDRIEKLARPDHKELIFMGGVGIGMLTVFLTALAVNQINNPSAQ